MKTLVNQLRTLSYVEIIATRELNRNAILYQAVSRRERMVRRGVIMSLDQFKANIAPHQQVIKCCDLVLDGTY